MLYRIDDGKLQFKDGAGEWENCFCPWLAGATCGLACPHFRRDQRADASGYVRGYITCGSSREFVLTV